MVGARRFERIGSRKDHRNGTYVRRLLTSLGQIDVTVPRSREGGSPSDVIGRYQRRSPELDEMMVEAYVSGISTRKMADVTEALVGERVGRSTVSRVTKRLDAAVDELRRSPIEGAHPYPRSISNVTRIAPRNSALKSSLSSSCATRPISTPSISGSSSPVPGLRKGRQSACVPTSTTMCGSPVPCSRSSCARFVATLRRSSPAASSRAQLGAVSFFHGGR